MIDQILKIDAGIPSAFNALGIGVTLVYSASTLAGAFEAYITLDLPNNSITLPTYFPAFFIALVSYISGLGCIRVGERLRRIRFDKRYSERLHYMVLSNENLRLQNYFRVASRKAELFDGLSIVVPFNGILCGLAISFDEKFTVFGGLFALSSIFVGNWVSRFSTRYFEEVDELIAASLALGKE